MYDPFIHSTKLDLIQHFSLQQYVIIYIIIIITTFACVKHCCMYYSNIFNPPQQCRQVGVVIISILEMRTLRKNRLPTGVGWLISNEGRLIPELVVNQNPMLSQIVNIFTSWPWVESNEIQKVNPVFKQNSNSVLPCLPLNDNHLIIQFEW